MSQLFDLAALYAKQGDETAKKAIYRRFFKKTKQDQDWMGDDAILAVDELEGLIFLAAAKGKILQDDPDEWQDAFLVDSFQQKHPNIAVYEMLEKAAQNTPAIKIYLEAILQSKSPRPSQERPRITYETIKDKIKDNVPVHLTPNQANSLSTQTLNKLAKDLLQETDRVRQATYLRIFKWVKFPFDHQLIFDIAKRKDKRADRLIENAVEALGFFTDPALRLFALEVLPKAKYPAVYTNLLINHYQEGDGKLLETLVLKASNSIRFTIWFGVMPKSTKQTKPWTAKHLCLPCTTK